MADKKKSPMEMTLLRKQAKKMLLEHRLSQKEIALKIGTSEKTISIWIKKYGWKTTHEQTLVLEGGNLSVQHLTGFVDVQEFGSYLQSADPKCYRSALIHLINYLHSLTL